MSRLTERDGRIAVRVGGCTKRNDPVFEKLAHYEDLEEQGRLIVLPCKIGDVVWIVGSKCLADYEPERWCEHHDCDKCIYDKEYITFQRRIGSFLACKMALKKEPNFVWGETVFATKAEAEAKLAELKEGGSDE